MTVEVTDLIHPKGILRSEMFPGENLEVIITDNWLPEAELKAAEANPDFRNEAIKDWVYYRGFSSIADRLAGEPDDISQEGVSRSISESRIGHFIKLAEHHKAQFFAAFSTSQIVTERSGNTTSVATRIKF